MKNIKKFKDCGTWYDKYLIINEEKAIPLKEEHYEYLDNKTLVDKNGLCWHSLWRANLITKTIDVKSCYTRCRYKDEKSDTILRFSVKLSEFTHVYIHRVLIKQFNIKVPNIKKYHHCR